MRFPRPRWLRDWWQPAAARAGHAQALDGLRAALRTVVRLANNVEMVDWPGAAPQVDPTGHDDRLRHALASAETELGRSIARAMARDVSVSALEHDVIAPLLRSETILTNTARVSVGKAVLAARAR